MYWRVAIGAWALGIWTLAMSTAWATQLDAAIYKDTVHISTDFHGEELFIFGTVAPGEKERHVIVVVEGPPRSVVIRKKKEVMGVWINGEQVTFREVPGFHRIAASLPLETLLPEQTLRQLMLVPRFSDYAPHSAHVEAGRFGEFHEGLIRNMVRSELFSERVGFVDFQGQSLFRIAFPLPETVSSGRYLVRTLLVEDGSVIARYAIPFTVAKADMTAVISNVSQRHPLLHGIIAVLIAISAGFIGFFAFRRL